MTHSLSLPANVLHLNYYNFERRSLLPQTPDALWKIESGIVRSLTWSEDGRVIGLGVWGAGDVVGSSISTSSPYNVECLTKVRAKSLPRLQWPYELDAILRHVQYGEELLQIVQCKYVEVAVWRMLNWLAKRFGQEVEDGMLIDMTLTHQEIAEMIGSTRVTVTRTLNKFVKHSVIQKQDRHWLLLADRQPFWHYEI